jgi:hypothetical protein
MRLIIVLLAMSLAAGPAQSQVLPTPEKHRRDLPAARALALTDAQEFTDCERRWEAATHMTKKQWSQTCRRVLDRLRLLDQHGSTR